MLQDKIDSPEEHQNKGCESVEIFSLSIFIPRTPN